MFSLYTAVIVVVSLAASFVVGKYAGAPNIQCCIQNDISSGNAN